QDDRVALLFQALDLGKEIEAPERLGLGGHDGRSLIVSGRYAPLPPALRYSCGYGQGALSPACPPSDSGRPPWHRRNRQPAAAAKSCVRPPGVRLPGRAAAV